MLDQSSHQSWREKWHIDSVYMVLNWVLFFSAVLFMGAYAQAYISRSLGNGIDVVLAENPARQNLINSTQRLNQALAELYNASPEFKSIALKELELRAKIRRYNMLALANGYPDEVLSLALFASERQKFPAQVQQYLEQRVTIEGAPNIRVLDTADESNSVEEFTIKPDNGPVVALLGSNLLRPGQDIKKIRITGISLGSNGRGQVVVVDEPVAVISSQNLLERALSFGGNFIETATAYVLAGGKWSNTNVTVSFMPDGAITDSGLPSNLFAKLNASFPTATWQREYARALATWAVVSPLNFHFVSDSGANSGISGSAQGDSRFGDIRLSAYSRSDGYVAYAYYPSSTTLGGDQFLSSNYSFNIGTYIDLYSVILHESGHSLGLAHSVSPAIMDSTIRGVYTGLDSDDIAGVQAKYGTRKPDSYDNTSSNNTTDTATAMNLNSGALAFNADLTTVDDVDYYKVIAPTSFNGALTVSTDARNLSFLIPKISVYDGTGGLLGSADAGTAYGSVAALDVTGLASGQTYYLVADGATSDVFGMGGYKLNAQFGGFVEPPDTTPPSVAITSHANGAVVGGNVTVSAAAADNVGVTKVEFFADGILKGTIATAPYHYSWNTTSVADGSHILVAKAYDAAGNIGTSAAVSVVVDNTAPSVPVDLSAPSITNNQIVLSWTASADANGIGYYKIVRTGKSATTSDTLYIDNGLTSCTSYSYTVTAYDVAGNVSPGSSVTATTAGCDTVLPSVNIDLPIDGAVLSGKGNTTVQVSAADSSGIRSIQIFLDDILKKTCSNATSCTAKLPNNKILPGSHSINAIAVDNTNNTTTKTISVTK